MGLFNLFKKKEKTYICIRCKKEITDKESSGTGNHRFCADCAASSQKTTAEKHIERNTFICSKCGKELDKSCLRNNNICNDCAGESISGASAQPKPSICTRCKKEITDEESYWIANYRFCTDCAPPSQKTTVSGASAQPKTSICIRCKREVTDEESIEIGKYRICKDCALPSPKTTAEKHIEKNTFICSKCGKELEKRCLRNDDICNDCAGEIISRALAQPKTDICARCGKELEKQYIRDNNLCDDCIHAFISEKLAQLETDIDVQSEETAADIENKKELSDCRQAPDETIRQLRKDIIQSISETPATTYQLAALLWDKAAKCFPTPYSFDWDGAWFKLDLINQKLYADVGTYPNQFGASRKDGYGLTAAEFHQKAVEFNMSTELQSMETEADWKALFDEELTSAVAKARWILDSGKREQQRQQQISHALVIPDEFLTKKPTMEFDELRIELNQRFGSRSVWLAKRNGKYTLNPRRLWADFQGILSPAESAWFEQQVKDCIQNQDRTTWQSLAGYDSMSVKICAQGEVLVNLSDSPLRKYTDLLNLLCDLEKYGSFTDTEAQKAAE